MTDIFNQTMMDDVGTGRGSIKVNPDELDFSQEPTVDTEHAEFFDSMLIKKDDGKTNEIKMDMRKSSLIRSRKEKKVNLEDFEIVMQLGKGTFGKVYLATLPNSTQKYAIKAIRKDVLLEYDQV